MVSPDAHDAPDPDAGEAARAGSPSSSTTRTQPPKQIACERCKRRKAKCDRHLPQCHRCQSAGVECEYANRRRPPGFPSGHRQVLESKINRLEADIARLRSTAGPESSVSSTKQVAESPSTVIEPASTSVRTGRIKEKKPPADLVYSLSSLYFRHIHHWLPFLDARHVFADFATSEEPSLVAYALFGASLPFSRDSRLATREARDSYWKYLKRLIAVEALEEPSFVSLEALSVLVLDVSGMTHGPQVWGVLAVAIKMALQLENITGRALRTSSAVVDQGFRPEQTAIRRLFWAVYALDCYISITTRHASELTDVHTQYLLSIRDSIWKSSSETTPGGMFPAHSPSSQGSVTPALTPHVVFGYQLELLDISRRAHSLYLEWCSCGEGSPLSPRWVQSVMGCSSGLNAWYTDLPPGMQISPSVSPSRGEEDRLRASPMVVMLNAYYHGLTVYLHGLIDFFPRHGVCADAQHVDYQADNRTNCASAVDALCSLGAAYVGPFGDKIGWPFAWACFLAARYCLVTQYCGRPLPTERLDQLIRCLEELGRYWQISGHYLRLVLRSRDELEGMADGREVEGQQLLGSMVDWRVAVCDLEDQARVDPMLPGREMPPTAVDGAGMYDLDMLMGDSQMESISVAGGPGNLTSQTPGGWFAPGFPETPGQQFLGPDQGLHRY